MIGSKELVVAVVLVSLALRCASTFDDAASIDETSSTVLQSNQDRVKTSSFLFIRGPDRDNDKLSSWSKDHNHRRHPHLRMLLIVHRDKPRRSKHHSRDDHSTQSDSITTKDQKHPLLITNDGEPKLVNQETDDQWKSGFEQEHQSDDELNDMKHMQDNDPNPTRNIYAAGKSEVGQDDFCEDDSSGKLALFEPQPSMAATLDNENSPLSSLYSLDTLGLCVLSAIIIFLLVMTLMVLISRREQSMPKQDTLTYNIPAHTYSPLCQANA